MQIFSLTDHQSRMVQSTFGYSYANCNDSMQYLTDSSFNVLAVDLWFD